MSVSRLKAAFFLCLSFIYLSGSGQVQPNSLSHFSDKPTAQVPAKVYRILEYVNTYGRAPEGYVGGRKFGNYEGLLPKKDFQKRFIAYREWDVNPKVEGKNRGAERLVTGSNKKAYYTNNHYKSFVEIR